MHDKIQRAPFFANRLKQRVHRSDIFDIARHDEVGAKFRGERFDTLAERFTLIGEGQFRALCRNALEIPQAME